MNRFLRIAYFVSLVFLLLTQITVVVTGVEMPLLSFLLLIAGILTAQLPDGFERIATKQKAFAALGAFVALLGVVPLLAFSCPVMHFIVYGIGIAVWFVFSAMRRKNVTRTWFLHVFRISLIVLGSVLAAFFLGVFPQLKDSGVFSFGWERVRLAIDNGVPMVILLLSIGILLLRRLRSEQGGMDPQAIKRRQVRDLSIFGILTGVICVIRLFVNLRSVFDLLYDKVILPLFRWIAQLFAGIFSVTHTSVGATPPPPMEFNLPDPSIFQAASDPRPSDAQPIMDGLDLPLPDREVVYKTILVVFIAVSILVLAVLLITGIRRLLDRYRGRRIVPGYPNETVEEITEEEPEQYEDAPKKHSEDPRERMRYQYGEFLRYLRKTPVAVARTDTCGEIVKNASDGLHVEPTRLNDFTELYEKARYRQQTPVTDADAHRMKSLLAEIKSD